MAIGRNRKRTGSFDSIGGLNPDEGVFNSRLPVREVTADVEQPDPLISLVLTPSTSARADSSCAVLVGQAGGAVGHNVSADSKNQSPTRYVESTWKVKSWICASGDRAPCAGRVTPLEESVRWYADKTRDNVMRPEIGMSFDSLGEAYDFYNLYSWELGFGIRIKNLMWTNGSSKLPYRFFDDVITFDTTYRTNLYDMPFDQARVVEVAIESELPGTVHRWLNHMISVEEFKTAWDQLIEKHNLKSHNYMTGIYEYMRLQFDRESDESYQEKRTRISGAEMRTNIAIERHASKIYTRKMFELFDKNLFEGGAYQVEEVVRKKKYIARHNDAEKRRSSTLYLHAMELVGIGDSSVSTYELVLGRIKDLIMEAVPLAETRDGLGIEDRIAAESTRKSVGEAIAFVNNEGGTVANENNMTCSENWDALTGMAAPSKKRSVGRPCSNREKAPYEGLSKRTRFCSICKLPGHKKTTCPERGNVPKQPRKPVTSKNCGITGHRCTLCTL
ncbi:hypothetical protein D1007_00893 [Hordeum vulgare]|nr:hypothetical protein D1007_00893 [Hordeum vulgare]